jgi:hypothetical protein
MYVIIGNVQFKELVMANSLQSVVDKFPEDVRNKYDFSSAVYTTALKPITGIICSTHGAFQQYAAQLRKGGSGCPSCGEEKRIQSRRMDPEEFTLKAASAHSGKYDYSKTLYVNMTTKIDVLCPHHGEFKISPLKHLYETQGCPTCGASSRGKRLNVSDSARKSADSKIKIHSEKFALSAERVHGDAYDYGQVVYTGAQSKVDIVCHKHGVFSQTPEHHLKRGHGCPQCGHILSKQESRIASYLANLTKVVQRDRTIIKPKELDIYLPDHSIALEYCGMYWHSHDNKEDEMENKYRHYDKYVACGKLGIRLITLYESEWENHEFAIRRLLRNFTGKSRGKLMARKCEIKKVQHHEARQFFDKYHPQGGNGNGENYGLFHNQKLVACMRFAFGINDRGGSERTWTLARYATRITVSGGASKLFTAFLEDKNPLEVKSFSDNRLFSGNMYEKLGFVLEAEIQPDYQVWSQKLGLLPKTHYQRKNIPKRLLEHGLQIDFDPETDTRTETEMTYLMGARRIYDCGKKRWVFKNSCP